MADIQINIDSEAKSQGNNEQSVEDSYLLKIQHLSEEEKYNIYKSSVLNLTDDEKVLRPYIDRYIQEKEYHEQLKKQQEQVYKTPARTSLNSLLILLVPIFLVCLVLPCVQIGYAATYKDTISCGISTIISPYTWLLTSGITGLCLGILIISTTYIMIVNFGINTAFITVLSLLLIPCGLFSFSWIIIGSVMYWRDCAGTIQPTSVDSLIKASLIIAYISFGMQLLKRK